MLRDWTPDVYSLINENLRQVVNALATDIEAAAFAWANVVGSEDDGVTILTSEDVRLLAAFTGDEHAGPSTAAFVSGRVQHIPSTAAYPKWLEYRNACLQIGIYSVAAFPIKNSSKSIGALTVASYDYRAFGTIELRLGIQAAALAGQLIDAG